MEFSVYLPPPETNSGGAEQTMSYPPNTEAFYRNASLEAIKARVKNNPMEQETFLNAANHDMDEIAARTTANGGVLNADDAARLKKIRGEMAAVTADNPGPENQAFVDRMNATAARAREYNPADRDYISMDAKEIAPAMRGNKNNQEEYLYDLDNEIDRLHDKYWYGGANQPFTAEDKKAYERLKAQVEGVIRANPDEVGFNYDLDSRLKRIEGDLLSMR